MNIQRALTFASRMTLPYIRIALSVTLMLVSIFGLSFFGMALFILLWHGIANSANLQNELRFIAQFIGYLALTMSSLLSIGLLWNLLGVLVGVSLTSKEPDFMMLRMKVPRYLFFYNSIGLPVLMTLCGWLLGIQIQSEIAAGVLFFMFGITSAYVATRAWERAVDWREFHGRIKKKKPPSFERLMLESSESDVTNKFAVEDDVARLRKLR
jgi:hypothetical protein